jgi:hypothetical protein
LHAPELALVAEAILADHFQLGVEALLLEGAAGLLEGLAVCFVVVWGGFFWGREERETASEGRERGGCGEREGRRPRLRPSHRRREGTESARSKRSEARRQL